MNNVVYFEIQASDPDRAIRFYQAAFNWKFQKQDGLPVAYWRIETEGIRGGLMQRPVPAPPPQTGANAFVCSIEVTDFDSAMKTILLHGGQVALPKFAVPGVCWQGYFLDPEGNTVGLFQVDMKAGQTGASEDLKRT